MKKVVWPVALIRKIELRKSFWLVRHSRLGHSGFVTTPTLGAESPRVAIKREVAWVLDVDAQCDWLVTELSAEMFEEHFGFFGGDKVWQGRVVFFLFDLFRREAVRRVSQDSGNDWLTTREVIERQAVLRTLPSLGSL